MSYRDPGESRTQDTINATRGLIRCRIPQRLPPGRNKPPPYKFPVNTKPNVIKATQQPRYVSRSTSRPRSSDSQQIRPKSASRKDDKSSPKSLPPISGLKRTDRERLLPKKPPSKTVYTNRAMTCLPDQETINRHQDLELEKGDLESVPSPCSDLDERESPTLQKEKVALLKSKWQENIILFEEMKHELIERQKAIIEVYASLGMTHEKMCALGQPISLPPADELRIMNVANMTPEQLLQLCSVEQKTEGNLCYEDVNAKMPVDMKRLYNMPLKLIQTCEQTLVKRKEIIDSLESMTKKKDISLSELLRKIKDFNAENEMLASFLKRDKDEFFTELNDIVYFIRKCVNDTIAVQVRNEQLICEISELNAQKGDLQRRLRNADNLKSNSKKATIEDLEKQLKEEKLKRSLMKNRLYRADGQVKNTAEQVSQLEAALEQSRSTCWNLERTVQQLREQNQNLQNEYDKELNKLTDSIRKNTAHLEEIADAREKLQTEKEELEKRIAELSAHYNESLKHMKHEMNNNIKKIIEVEKKYEDEKDHRQKIEEKVEFLTLQLIETEQHSKNILKQLQDRELQLSKTVECYRDLETAKHELVITTKEMNGYRNELAQQNETIREIELSFNEALKLKENLKLELKNKDEHISELENNISLLENQLQDSENKMGSYEKQLSLLKGHICELQEDFGEFENLNELKEMINQQRSKLLEATRQNVELAEALDKKDIDLIQFVETIAKQENIIEQKDEIIDIISNKEKELANNVKLLRNNLEMRAKADVDLHQKLADKTAEMDSLITNLETKKQQLNQLEKIILTLEDQTRKLSAQNRKDQEKIVFLENKIAESETYHLEQKQSRNSPAENLDSIIKILENELESPLNLQPLQSKPSYSLKKTNAVDHNSMHKNQAKYEFHDDKKVIMPSKIPHVKNAHERYTGDVHRKKENNGTDCTKYISTPGAESNVYDIPTEHENVTSNGIRQPRPKENHLSRNIHFLAPLLRQEKRGKMYKFAGHRL